MENERGELNRFGISLVSLFDFYFLLFVGDEVARDV